MPGLSNVLFQQGMLNPAGTKTKLYVALHSDILQFPPLPAQNGELHEISTITSKFVMKPTKKFHELYITLEKGLAGIKLVGDRDGKSFESMVSGNYPDLDAQILGFLKVAANENLAVIWKDQKNRTCVIGFDPEVPADLITGDGTTGEKISDAKGMKLEFRNIGDSFYFYDAYIPVTAAAAVPNPTIVFKNNNSAVTTTTEQDDTTVELLADFGSGTFTGVKATFLQLPNDSVFDPLVWKYKKDGVLIEMATAPAVNTPIALPNDVEGIVATAQFNGLGNKVFSIRWDADNAIEPRQVTAQIAVTE